MSRVAIIGGTGIDELSNFSSSLKVHENEYGRVFYHECNNIIFLPRHSRNHSVPPHLINYKANIECLKSLGVEKVISIYAIGSITDKLKPLEFALVDDFIDLRGNSTTFFTGYEKGVRHVDMSEPFDVTLQNKIEKIANIDKRVVYATTNGPRFETKAEIRAYRSLGADVVGMTLANEATLLKEVSIKNVAIAYSINWAAGVNNSISFVSDDDISKLTSKLVDIAIKALT